MFESMLAMTVYFVAIFIPVLIPATVHAVHFARAVPRSYLPLRPLRALGRVRLPRLVLPRRVPAPAIG